MAKKTRSVEVNGRQIRLRPERYSWSDFFMALPAVLLLVFCAVVIAQLPERERLKVPPKAE